MHTVKTGKIYGKRDRGRQLEKIPDSHSSKHVQMSADNLIHSVGGGEIGKRLTTHTSLQNSLQQYLPLLLQENNKHQY